MPGNLIIASKQRAFVERVQALVPARPILVQPLHAEPAWQQKTEWVPLARAPPGELWTRAIALNEVVFDFDTRDYALLRQRAGAVQAVFEQTAGHDSYLLGLSGGKGAHIHAWLDFSTLNADADLLTRAARVDVCPFSVARETFANAILDGARHPEPRWSKDGGILDILKVRWSSARSGSMIREWGCRGSRGFRKTVVDALPDALPDATNAPPLRIPEAPTRLIRFPVPLLARYRRVLREQVAAAEAAQAAPRCLDAKDPMDVPCVKRTVEQGVGLGARHAAHINLVVTYYRMGRGADEARAALALAVEKHGLSEGDSIEKLVQQVYTGRWRAPANLSCPSPLVSGLCDPNACALSRHMTFG